MKKLRTYLSIILAICLMCSFSLTYASTADSYDASSLTVNKDTELEDFISYISHFFDSNYTFSAIDFDGNDISKAFYDSYYSLYSSEEYKALKEFADKHIAYLLQINMQTDPDMLSSYSPYSVRITHNVSDYKVHYTNPPRPFVSQEYSTLLTSSFDSDPFSGVIFSAQNPALTCYHDGGGSSPHELTNVIIYTPVKGTDKVTFKASFSLYKVIEGERQFAGSFTHTESYNSAGTRL